MNVSNVRTLFTLLLGTTAIFASSAARAYMVYEVDQTVGGGTVTGTIVTSGAIGALAAGDITDWELFVTGLESATVTLTPEASSWAGVAISGGSLFADSSALYFDFDAGAGQLLFQLNLASGTNYWCLQSSDTTPTDVGAFCAANYSIVPGAYDDGTQVLTHRHGNQLIATAVSTVPLPGAAWLLLSGLGGLGVVSRRRKTG